MRSVPNKGFFLASGAAGPTILIAASRFCSDSGPHSLSKPHVKSRKRRWKGLAAYRRQLRNQDLARYLGIYKSHKKDL